MGDRVCVVCRDVIRDLCYEIASYEGEKVLWQGYLCEECFEENESEDMKKEVCSICKKKVPKRYIKAHEMRHRKEKE